MIIKKERALMSNNIVFVKSTQYKPDPLMTFRGVEDHAVFTFGKDPTTYNLERKEIESLVLGLQALLKELS